MPRELVWLDNDTFAAWGCSGCSWIVSKPGPVREQAPAGVKEAFPTSTTARISLAANRSAGEKPDIFHGLED